MPSASRRRPPPPHRRRAMLPTSSTLSVVSAPTPPKPLYLRRSLIAAALAVLLLLAAAYAPWRSDLPPAALLGRPAAPTARFYSFDLVREYPHDPDAFTQGLLYGGNDTLFESTGLYHRSSVRKVELPTGKVLVHHEMDGDMFGEGLTLLGSRLFQVTWLKNNGFIYDRHNFTKRKSFTHKMRDGWGLATDGKVLFGSDGTSKLYQMDPKSFEVMKMVTVKYQDNEVPFINELEYIDGEVWANVWQNIDVLNGIAWDEGNHRLFVTGKLWPKLYEIKLRPVDGPADGSVEKLCPKASFYR